MRPRNPRDRRERAVAAVAAGQARSEVVRAFGIHPRTLERWLARWRAGQGLADRPRSGRPPKLDPARYPQLREVALQQADATLAEHADRLATATGVRLSPSRVGRLLAGLGLPLKKNARRP